MVLRAHIPRLLAAGAVAALIAGCGSGGSGGSAQPAAGASGGPAPVSASAEDTFDPQLANQHAPSTAVSAGGLVESSASRPAKATSSKQASKKPVSKPATSKPKTSKAKSGTPAPSPSRTTGKATKPPVHASSPTHPSSPAAQRTITVTRTTPPRTVVRTVTRTVAPNVPAGAFMPSRHPALAQTRFTVPGGNVGCTFAAGGVRCDIQQRVWAAPLQPASCTGSWGNALLLRGHGAAVFACGGSSAISADAKVVPDGWDDKVGQVTCQVRSFGVDCFSAGRRGFIVSRTGYTLY